MFVVRDSEHIDARLEAVARLHAGEREHARETGEVAERGKRPTTAPALTELVERLNSSDELLVGQEVGTMAYFVFDVLTALGVKLLSFNAQQFRMIASSRKKTRDQRARFQRRG